MQLRAFALCLLLGGCTLLPPTAQAPAIPRPARAAIAAFAIDGRLAVRQGERNYVSGISWQHAAERDEMLLTTPLGQGIAELVRDRNGARLTMADRREITAANWDELSAKIFGFHLPLSALPRWLVADVPAQAQLLVRDAAGRPQRLRIDGWEIAYGSYESAAADALPTLVEMHRDDPDAIELRLKIDSWAQVR